MDALIWLVIVLAIVLGPAAWALAQRRRRTHDDAYEIPTRPEAPTNP